MAVEGVFGAELAGFVAELLPWFGGCLRCRGGGVVEGVGGGEDGGAPDGFGGGESVGDEVEAEAGDLDAAVVVDLDLDAGGRGVVADEQDCGGGPSWLLGDQVGEDG